MTKKKSLKINYIYNASYQIIAILVPLITTPYLSRILKADGIGTYSYTFSIVSIFGIFAALGTTVYGNREISYVSNDRKKRSQVFWEIEFLSIITDLVCIVAFIAFLMISNEYILLYSVQIFTLFSIACNISWLFQGMEEFKKIVIRNAIFKILSVIFIFVFVKSKNDLLLYALGLSALDFLGNLSIWLYLPKYVDKPDFKSLHPFRHFKYTFALFVPTIASSIYTLFDKAMLHFFTSEAFENGYYEQALKLSKTALTLITALESVMIPRIGALFVSEKHDEMRSLLYKSYRFVWILGLPLSFGLIGISYNFVPWFYGEGYDSVSNLLMILGLLIPIIGLSNVTGIQYLITTKRERIVSITVSIGALCNVLLNLIFIPRLFALGAAISSVCAELIISSLQIYYVRKEISPLKIFKSSIKYFVAATIMLVLLISLNKIFTPTIFHTVVMISSGFLVYLLVLAIERDSLFLELFNKIWAKIKDRS